MASTTQRPELFSGLQEGALVIADISGYSAFVQQTEVDHSWSILHELLDACHRRGAREAARRGTESLRAAP